MVLLRKLFFILVVVILAACGGGGEDYKAILAKGKINSSDFRMDMTVEDIELKFGIPDAEQAILDWGYYGYSDFGIFFTEKFSFFDGEEIVKTNKEENSVAFARWFKDISIFGLIIDFSNKDDVFTKLGQPAEKYITFPEDEYGSFFAGHKLKYVSGKYCIIVSYNEEEIVTDIILGPADLKL